MRILSFDISASPGVALLDVKDGKPRIFSVDHVETDSDSTDAQRYEVVEAFVKRFIFENPPPDAIVREKFIRGGSKRSTQLVFGAWASVDRALATFGYSIDDKDEIVASQVKRHIGGKGGATKEEVAEGVIKRMGEDSRRYFYTERGRLLDDRTDAVAIGLTYLIKNGIIEEGAGQCR